METIHVRKCSWALKWHNWFNNMMLKESSEKEMQLQWYQLIKIYPKSLANIWWKDINRALISLNVTRCVIASVLSCSVLKLIHVQGGILYYISLMPLSIHLNGCGKPNLLNRIFPQWAFGQINKLPDSGRWTAFHIIVFSYPLLLTEL